MSNRMPTPGAADLAEWKRACGALRAAVEAGNRPAFVAHAIPDGSFWYIEIDGVPRLGYQPGAFTQAASIEEIEPMAREVTSIVLGIPEDSFDLRVETSVPQ